MLKWLEGYHPLMSVNQPVMAAVTHDSTPTLNPTLVLSSADTQKQSESKCEGVCVYGSCVLVHDVK